MHARPCKQAVVERRLTIDSFFVVGCETEAEERQLRMLLCMESAAHIPRLENAHFLRQFHLTATYRLDSHIPVLYAPGNTSIYAYGAAHSALETKVCGES